MKIRVLFALAVLLQLAASPARADIYKCIGADGHVMYSNMADKNCKRLSLDPTPASAPAAKAAVRTPTPATFPKVEEGAQKSRDNDRRRILEGELAAERKNLEQARKELAEQQESALPEERVATQRCTTVTLKDGKLGQSCSATPGGINVVKMDERIQPFKDKVALHERNIEAIQSELSRLR